MYKNLINQIVEEKAKQAEIDRKVEANRKRIENAKFSTGNLYVGYVCSIIITKDRGRNRLKKLTDSKARILKYTSKDTFQDIESEEFYPLVREGQYPNEKEYCILEASLSSFEAECIETLSNKGIEPNSKLSKTQLRQILEEQQKLNRYRF